MAYDSRCHDIAEAFLEDEPAMKSARNVRRLAQCVQDSIEDWIAYERAEPLSEPAAEPEERK